MEDSSNIEEATTVRSNDPLQQRSDASPAPSGHHWTIVFDRIVCRDCRALLTDDVRPSCRGARTIRPIAKFRQQPEERA